MKSNFKSELKTVLKVARWEYILKLFISVMLRGVLLAIPVLFSIAVNAVTQGDKELFLTMTIVSIILAGVYRFLEISLIILSTLTSSFSLQISCINK